MKKQEIIRNICLITIPACLFLFWLGWLVFHNTIAAAILPVLLFAGSLYSNISRYLLDIRRDKAGFTKHRFQTRNVYDLVAPNDYVAPSLCVEIENDKYLLLNGQWLYNADTYGKDSKKYYDGESNIFNCYDNPYSFPATEFELWVSNMGNQPYRIVVSGNYIEPKVVKWLTPEKYCKEGFFIIDKKDLRRD